jgi:hypothetical protein
MPQVAFSPVGNEQFFDNDGNPLAGGKLWFYTFGSFSIPRQTYTDYTAQVANPFPIVLDSAGRPPDDIFINIFGKYNVTLTKSDGTTVLQTWTNISPVSGTATINFQYADSVLYTGTGSLLTATNVDEALGMLSNALLLPLQPGNSGKYLTTDGNTASWSFLPVASVSGFTNQTTATYVDNNVTVKLTDNVMIAGIFTATTINGTTINGTTINAATINAATSASNIVGGINALLPSQTNNINRFLQTDGTNTTWTTVTNLLTIKDITSASYQLILADSTNTLLRMNYATTSSVVIPADNVTNLPIGSAILITQIGTGTVTTTASSGVTLLSPETFNISKQYGKVVLIKTSSNLWEIDGNLETI